MGTQTAQAQQAPHAQRVHANTTIYFAEPSAKEYSGWALALVGSAVRLYCCATATLAKSGRCVDRSKPEILESNVDDSMIRTKRFIKTNYYVLDPRAERSDSE